MGTREGYPYTTRFVEIFIGNPLARVSPFFRYEVKLWASRRKEAALILRNPTGGRVSKK